MKSGTLIRLGSSPPQSTKEFSPTRKHLRKPSWKCYQVGRRNWSSQFMSTSHSGGKWTTKCQGVGVVTWRECSWGISACCMPHPQQTKTHPRRLCNLHVQAFAWCVRVVEYKCPWKHRDLHPIQAFLTPKICASQNGNNCALKFTSNYYIQFQPQMFVSWLTLCTFVGWTNKAIFTVEVPYDPSFMSDVCAKLEKFWTSPVLPVLIGEVATTSLPRK